MTNVLDHFPHKTFRPFQKETILEIKDYLEDNAIENVILESPTGSGKSAIAICLGLYFKSAFLLTSQKILQDQYTNDYCSDKVRVLKGRNNYPCVFLPGFTCEDSYCSRKKCPVKEDCLYEIAKKQTVLSHVALMNYKYFLCALNYTTTFDSRKLLICDEAHSLDDECMSFVEFSFSSFYLSKLGITSKIPIHEELNDYVAWLKMILSILKKRKSEASEKLKNKFLENEEIAVLQKELESLISQEEKVNAFLSSYDRIEWIFDITTNEKLRSKTITFKPLTVGYFAQQLIFKHATKKMFMSATILDKESFCKNLDLDIEKTKFVQIDSTFSPDIRPIILTRSGNLGKNDIDKTLPKIAEDVGRILEFHDNVKGLVHCVSEDSFVTTKNGKVLVNELKQGDYIETYNEISKRFEFKKVNDIIDQGKRECLRLVFRSTEIICTPDHLILTKNRGWTKAKDLDSNDDVVSTYSKRLKSKCVICGKEFMTIKKESVKTCSPKCQGILRCNYRKRPLKLNEYTINNFLLYNLDSKKLDNRKKIECLCKRCGNLFITSINQQINRNYKWICRKCATKKSWENETCIKNHKESNAKSWTVERRQISRNTFLKQWKKPSFRKKVLGILRSENVQRKSVRLSKIARHKHIRAFNEFFKSTYEFRLAKVLNENSIKWEYEPKRFKIFYSDKEFKYYYPDFYLPEYNLWIEVKGYWFEHQKIKFRKFLEQYKNIKIKVFYNEQIRKIEDGDLSEIIA